MKKYKDNINIKKIAILSSSVVAISAGSLALVLTLNKHHAIKVDSPTTSVKDQLNKLVSMVNVDDTHGSLDSKAVNGFASLKVTNLQEFKSILIKNKITGQLIIRHHRITNDLDENGFISEKDGHELSFDIRTLKTKKGISLFDLNDINKTDDFEFVLKRDNKPFDIKGLGFTLKKHIKNEVKIEAGIKHENTFAQKYTSINNFYNDLLNHKEISGLDQNGSFDIKQTLKNIQLEESNFENIVFSIVEANDKNNKEQNTHLKNGVGYQIKASLNNGSEIPFVSKTNTAEWKHFNLIKQLVSKKSPVFTLSSLNTKLDLTSQAINSYLKSIIDPLLLQNINGTKHTIHGIEINQKLKGAGKKYRVSIGGVTSHDKGTYETDPTIDPNPKNINLKIWQIDSNQNKITNIPSKNISISPNKIQAFNIVSSSDVQDFSDELAAELDSNSLFNGSINGKVKFDKSVTTKIKQSIKTAHSWTQLPSDQKSYTKLQKIAFEKQLDFDDKNIIVSNTDKDHLKNGDTVKIKVIAFTKPNQMQNVLEQNSNDILTLTLKNKKTLIEWSKVQTNLATAFQIITDAPSGKSALLKDPVKEALSLLPQNIKNLVSISLSYNNKDISHYLTIKDIANTDKFKLTIEPKIARDRILQGGVEKQEIDIPFTVSNLKTMLTLPAFTYDKTKVQDDAKTIAIDKNYELKIIQDALTHVAKLEIHKIGTSVNYSYKIMPEKNSQVKIDNIKNNDNVIVKRIADAGYVFDGALGPVKKPTTWIVSQNNLKTKIQVPLNAIQEEIGVTQAMWDSIKHSINKTTNNILTGKNGSISIDAQKLKTKIPGGIISLQIKNNIQNGSLSIGDKIDLTFAPDSKHYLKSGSVNTYEYTIKDRNSFFDSLDLTNDFLENLFKGITYSGHNGLGTIGLTSSSADYKILFKEKPTQFDSSDFGSTTKYVVYVTFEEAGNKVQNGHLKNADSVIFHIALNKNYKKGNGVWILHKTIDHKFPILLSKTQISDAIDAFYNKMTFTGHEGSGQIQISKQDLDDFEKILAKYSLMDIKFELISGSTNTEIKHLSALPTNLKNADKLKYTIAINQKSIFDTADTSIVKEKTVTGLKKPVTHTFKIQNGQTIFSLTGKSVDVDDYYKLLASGDEQNPSLTVELIDPNKKPDYTLVINKENNETKFKNDGHILIKVVPNNGFYISNSHVLHLKTNQNTFVIIVNNPTTYSLSYTGAQHHLTAAFHKNEHLGIEATINWKGKTNGSLSHQDPYEITYKAKDGYKLSSPATTITGSIDHDPTVNKDVIPSFSVSASLFEFSGNDGSATATLKQPVSGYTISLSPSSGQLHIGETVQWTAMPDATHKFTSGQTTNGSFVVPTDKIMKLISHIDQKTWTFDSEPSSLISITTPKDSFGIGLTPTFTLKHSGTDSTLTNDEFWSHHYSNGDVVTITFSAQTGYKIASGVKTTWTVTVPTRNIMLPKDLGVVSDNALKTAIASASLTAQKTKVVSIDNNYELVFSKFFENTKVIIRKKQNPSANANHYAWDFKSSQGMTSNNGEHLLDNDGTIKLSMTPAQGYTYHQSGPNQIDQLKKTITTKIPTDFAKNKKTVSVTSLTTAINGNITGNFDNLTIDLAAVANSLNLKSVSLKAPSVNGKLSHHDNITLILTTKDDSLFDLNNNTKEFANIVIDHDPLVYKTVISPVVTQTIFDNKYKKLIKYSGTKGHGKINIQDLNKEFIKEFPGQSLELNAGSKNGQLNVGDKFKLHLNLISTNTKYKLPAIIPEFEITVESKVFEDILINNFTKPQISFTSALDGAVSISTKQDLIKENGIKFEYKLIKKGTTNPIAVAKFTDLDNTLSNGDILEIKAISEPGYYLLIPNDKFRYTVNTGLKEIKRTDIDIQYDSGDKQTYKKYTPSNKNKPGYEVYSIGTEVKSKFTIRSFNNPRYTLDPEFKKDANGKIVGINFIYKALPGYIFDDKTTTYTITKTGDDYKPWASSTTTTESKLVKFLKQTTKNAPDFWLDKEITSQYSKTVHGNWGQLLDNILINSQKLFLKEKQDIDKITNPTIKTDKTHRLHLRMVALINYLLGAGPKDATSFDEIMTIDKPENLIGSKLLNVDGSRRKMFGIDVDKGYAGYYVWRFAMKTNAFDEFLKISTMDELVTFANETLYKDTSGSLSSNNNGARTKPKIKSFVTNAFLTNNTGTGELIKARWISSFKSIIKNINKKILPQEETIAGFFGNDFSEHYDNKHVKHSITYSDWIKNNPSKFVKNLGVMIKGLTGAIVINDDYTTPTTNVDGNKKTRFKYSFLEDYSSGNFFESHLNSYLKSKFQGKDINDPKIRSEIIIEYMFHGAKTSKDVFENMFKPLLLDGKNQYMFFVKGYNNQYAQFNSGIILNPLFAGDYGKSEGTVWNIEKVLPWYNTPSDSDLDKVFTKDKVEEFINVLIAKEDSKPKQDDKNLGSAFVNGITNMLNGESFSATTNGKTYSLQYSEIVKMLFDEANLKGKTLAKGLKFKPFLEILTKLFGIQFVDDIYTDGGTTGKLKWYLDLNAKSMFNFKTNGDEVATIKSIFDNLMMSDFNAFKSSLKFSSLFSSLGAWTPDELIKNVFHQPGTTVVGREWERFKTTFLMSLIKNPDVIDQLTLDKLKTNIKNYFINSPENFQKLLLERQNKYLSEKFPGQDLGLNHIFDSKFLISKRQGHVGEKILYSQAIKTLVDETMPKIDNYWKTQKKKPIFKFKDANGKLTPTGEFFKIFGIDINNPKDFVQKISGQFVGYYGDTPNRPDGDLNVRWNMLFNPDAITIKNSLNPNHNINIGTKKTLFSGDINDFKAHIHSRIFKTMFYDSLKSYFADKKYDPKNDITLQEVILGMQFGQIKIAIPGNPNTNTKGAWVLGYKGAKLSDLSSFNIQDIMKNIERVYNGNKAITTHSTRATTKRINHAATLTLPAKTIYSNH